MGRSDRPWSIVVRAAAQAPAVQAHELSGVIPRFAREPSPIALTGDARPSRYMEASGRKAAFLGREDGSFEAWVYPLKVMHDFHLAFGIGAYADPIPATSLATTVDIRPEASTVRYSHAVFTVDATWFVPLSDEGGLVLLDVTTSEPLTVVVKFRPDLKPMWPAGLGGQYSYWDDGVKAYVIGEGSGKNAALIGSPLGLTPPEQPAHNLPDAPSQFSIAISPEVARRGLVPIVVAASVQGLDAAKKTYARLLSSTEALYREQVGRARVLHDDFMSVETPDRKLNLAFEWGKVALDKGLVCNPNLGCGLIAGLGPSGTTERPGFGWYFGGDAFINSWAIEGYGDFETVKTSLEFLRKRQRADGKMMHELSQSDGFVRWFEDYGYGYYHADTTPLYIIAVRDYVQASGDDGLAKDFGPSIRKAYDYCASTDEDGDGLMDNTRAGVAAAETGSLRRRDVLTDVFLASVWTEATGAAADLARIAEPSFGATAEAAFKRARTSLNARFLDDNKRTINYAIMKDGKGQSEQTVWPAVGLWRGMFDANRPAVEGMLDELARAGIGSDWGTRMLSKDSTLYQPLGYNNGAVWPFLTGFAALALYNNHRPAAAWGYLDAMADLTFLEARGYIPELLSGDRLRTLDAAVPHQLFATSGFMSTVIRGLVGIGPGEGGRLRIAPQPPDAWGGYLYVRHIRWRDARLSVSFGRSERGLLIAVNPERGVPDLELDVALPAGTVVDRLRPARGTRQAVRVDSDARGTYVRIVGRFEKQEQIFVPVRENGVGTEYGISVSIPQALPFERPAWSVPELPLALGDAPGRLRIIDARLDGDVYTVRVQGLRGRSYGLELHTERPIAGIEGATREATAPILLKVPIPAGPGEWGEVTIKVKLARQ
jgi:glycogen debranching enzyme